MKAVLVATIGTAIEGQNQAKWCPSNKLLDPARPLKG